MMFGRFVFFGPFLTCVIFDNFAVVGIFASYCSTVDYFSICLKANPRKHYDEENAAGAGTSSA